MAYTEPPPPPATNVVPAEKPAQLVGSTESRVSLYVAPPVWAKWLSALVVLWIVAYCGGMDPY